MKDSSLEKLVSDGVIKSYTYNCVGDYGSSPYETVTIEFLNGETLTVMSNGMGFAGSTLSIF